MVEILKNLFNSLMIQEEITCQWMTAKIILLHKKGNRNLIDNYRLISLCSTVSKVFASILKQCLIGIIMEFISEDQTGFRKGYSMTDHIQTINCLRFADDIVLLASTAEDLTMMIKTLLEMCRKGGFSHNFDKTKLMTNSEKVEIKIGNHNLEYI